MVTTGLCGIEGAGCLINRANGVARSVEGHGFNGVQQMDHDSSDGSAVWKVATIVLGMIAAGACAYSFMLYDALSTDLAAAKLEIRLAHDEVLNLRVQLSSS